MTREILFRGKRIDNGEWAHGYLTKRPSAIQIGNCSPWYISVPPMDPDDDGGLYNIDTATVGQYTGLRDKNGKRIFDGDILGGHYDEDNPEDLAIEVVIWHKNGWYTKSGSHLPDAMDEKECLPRTEVIGNIHDNPELLKEGE